MTNKTNNERNGTMTTRTIETLASNGLAQFKGREIDERAHRVACKAIKAEAEEMGCIVCYTTLVAVGKQAAWDTGLVN